MTSNEGLPRARTPKKHWTTLLTEKPKPFDEVDPHIIAILQYQKGRHDSNPQPLIVSPVPSSPSDSFKSDEEQSTSSNSDHYEVDSKSAHCIRSDSPRDFNPSVDTTPCIFEAPAYDMLNARNLSGLLTENTDEHASHFMSALSQTPKHRRRLVMLTTSVLENSVFTCYGTLMGYSDSVKLKFARKVSALAGATWRSTETALYEAAERDEAFLGGAEGPVTATPTLLKTLSITAIDNDGRLTSMVVDVGGIIAAVSVVKGTILVAALVHADMAAESKKIATKAKENPSRSDQPQHAKSPNSSSVDSGDVTIHDESSATDSAHGEDRNRSVKGKGKESEEDGILQEQRRRRSTGSSQIRILSWRADAMAEALRGDLRGFTLPDGAY